MAIIKSGASTDLWTIDATAKAAHVTDYDIKGVTNLACYTFDAATSAAFTPAATPTDVFAIIGSPSSDIRVTRIRIATTQATASGINNWFLIKRSSANVGGTFTYPVMVPRDSTSPLPTATVVQYSANPTLLGAVAGTTKATRLFSPLVTTAGDDIILWDFDDWQSQASVLHGTGESLCINFAGTTLPTSFSVVISITWTER